MSGPWSRGLIRLGADTGLYRTFESMIHKDFMEGIDWIGLNGVHLRKYVKKLYLSDVICKPGYGTICKEEGGDNLKFWV